MDPISYTTSLTPNKHPPSIHHNLNENEEEEAKLAIDVRENLSSTIIKEAMFEKSLTPSDVGKLNRLVIPKQHAEKYFPLAANNNNDYSAALLLSFEDESGKSWRFRYSYWNSSQSYVLTKGWSRFVKDKRLHAGDFVVFHRSSSYHHHFFIGSRPRHTPLPHIGSTRMLYNTTTTTHVPTYPTIPSLPYHQPEYYPHAGLGFTGGVGGRERRRRVVRLFGVNLEYSYHCQSQLPHDNDQMEQPPISVPAAYDSTNYYNHTDICF